MEKYWKAYPAASPTPPAASTSSVAQPNKASILSEYNRHCLVLLSSQNEDEGWQPEMHRYLKDLLADVTKDTDIIKWWQVCICIINWDQQRQLMIFTDRECHGLVLWVTAGAGTGCEFVTLTQPVPTTWV